MAEAPIVTDRMFLTAAQVLADAVTDERLADRRAVPADRGAAGRVAVDRPWRWPEQDHEADVDAAMWWPDYVPYLPVHTDERRRVSET